HDPERLGADRDRLAGRQGRHGGRHGDLRLENVFWRIDGYPPFLDNDLDVFLRAQTDGENRPHGAYGRTARFNVEGPLRIVSDREQGLAALQGDLTPLAREANPDLAVGIELYRAAIGKLDALKAAEFRPVALPAERVQCRPRHE